MKLAGNVKIINENRVELETDYTNNSFEICYDTISSVTGNIFIEIENKKISDADYFALVVNDYSKPMLYIASLDRLREFIKSVPAKRVKKEIGEKKCIHVYDKERILRESFLSFADWLASFRKRVSQIKESASRQTLGVDTIITKGVSK